jgi:hypothetical protein
VRSEEENGQHVRSEIRNIKVVAKYGAFGNPDAMGVWIYGRRRDGRTVVCKNEIQADGSVKIWSDRPSDGPYLEQDMTEFTKDEWDRISSAGSNQSRVANKILKERTSI